jgi:hemin uptake protein HemP
MTAPLSASAFRLESLSTPVPEHDAYDLTRGGPLARIALNGQIYSLRITRQGKLILTK